MGVAVSTSPYQVGKYYHKVSEGHTPYIVQLTKRTASHVEVVRLPIIVPTQADPTQVHEIVPTASLTAMLHPLGSGGTKAAFVPRIAGTICEAWWGHRWRVVRITYVGRLLELQCAEEMYELPMPVESQDLAPVGTHLPVQTPAPPIRSTHRERMATHEYEAKVLRLRIELAAHEAKAVHETQTLQLLLHTITTVNTRAVPQNI